MTAHRHTAPLVAVIVLIALLVTGCTSSGDVFTDTLQIGGALVLCYCMVLIGRAIAGRLAGDKYETVLTDSILSISIALPQRKSESSSKEHGSTEDTSTPKYTEVHESAPQNTLESTPETLKLTGSGGDQVIMSTRITDAEKDEFDVCRRNAIHLLNKCVMYYRDRAEVDTGRIPRHDAIGMGSETRGPIVDTLWYSGFVSKGKNGTQIHPEYGNCRELMNGIISKEKSYRVYPVGFHERKKKLTDSAVMALPANERHD